MNKIFLWEGEYDLIYPSLFIFDRILTLEDTALDFALSTLDFVKSSGISLETMINLIKDRIIVPIIMSAPRDETRLSYEFLSARSKSEAKKIASQIETVYDYPVRYPDEWMMFPEKTRRALSELLVPSEKHTRNFIYVDYSSTPDPGERKVCGKFRDAQDEADRVADVVEERIKNNSAYSDLNILEMRELISGTTLSKVFNCSIVEDADHLTIYKRLLSELQSEIVRTPELRKILLETDKTLAFKQVLQARELRIPQRLGYPEIKAFRADSAHRNLSKWLTVLHRNVQKEEEPPVFDEALIQEIDELTKVIQDEIKRGGIVATAALSALAGYLACLHPVAILAVASSLASYVPLTYAFSRLYRKIGRSNFLFYFVDWRKPPIRAK